MQEPRYVATKSIIGSIPLWEFAACILIIPIIILVFEILSAKKYRIEFYDDTIVVKSGLFTKQTRNYSYSSVLSVDVFQSVMGRAFNFGTVTIDTIGSENIHVVGLSKPNELRDFLAADMKVNKAF